MTACRTSRLVPCSTCPWRLTSTEGGSDIPRFDIDLMRGLENTVGDTDDFRPIFACHHSTVVDETPCIGYVAVEGYSNLAVRIMAMEGRLDLPGIWEAVDGLPLWGSFHDMLRAYEAAAG